MATKDQDRSQWLTEQVAKACTNGTPLAIEAGGTKAFLGRQTQGEGLDVSGHCGVISHEPSELIVTARAGTRLTDLEATLNEQGQMLAFEPPAFGVAATLGGTLACGLSGPRRPYAGAARDFVLGAKVLTGKGEVLSFGGQVMKNVAGYDLSRLMTGAMGTLGVLLEASLKVLPTPAAELTMRFEMSAPQALHSLNAWAAKPLPISAACHDNGVLSVRLSGTPGGVETAATRMGGEASPRNDLWVALREHELEFFDTTQPLWRISVPPAAPLADLGSDAQWLLDWGGAQRWLRCSVSPIEVRDAIEAQGGHATVFRNGDRTGQIFHPLSPGIMRLHQRLKAAFDPQALLNRGRMYAEL